MKKIITWQEYTEMNPRQAGYDCDKLSRDIIKLFLQFNYGTKNVEINFTEGENCSDLTWIAPKSKNVYIGEIKDRFTYNSTDFNDHIIENVKAMALSNKIMNGWAQTAVIFSIYNDGVIKITKDIYNPGSFIKQQVINCPRTTMLGDHTIVPKLMNFYKPDELYYFYFEPQEDGSWLIQFSKDKKPEFNQPEFITDGSLF